MVFLLAFHAAISGSFLVAYLTGDEDSYGMHLVAGYTVLVALGLRLAAALAASSGSPLALPHPAPPSAIAAWIRRAITGDGQALRTRSPLRAWMAVAMLGFTLLAAASGWLADRLPRLEDLHGAIAELTPLVILAHLAIAVTLNWVRIVATRQPAPAAAGGRR
jgi:cytochrome b